MVTNGRLVRTLGIITARGGSKGVPGKNIKPLAGKPLICWTIEAALASNAIDSLVVSTDDAQIASIARECGAEVPFMRPAELATDASGSLDAILHALDWMKTHRGISPEWTLLLQPTSPLRTAEDITAAVALQRDKGADAVVSICESPHPVEWFRRLGPNGELLPLGMWDSPSRRQEAVKTYSLNGAIYLVRTEVLVRAKSFYPEGTIGYVMPPERSLDIDTPWDFHLANLVMEHRNGHKRD